MTNCDVRSEPWLTEGAIEFLSHFIKPGCRVLETGGGASTLWFLMFGCHVTTYEQDANWIEIVKSLLPPCCLRSELHLFIPPVPPEWEGYSDNSFNVVLIDTGCKPERDGCLRAAIRLVKPGGVLMADNADCAMVTPFVEEAKTLIPDWNYTISIQRRPDKFGFGGGENASGWATAWWHRPPLSQSPGTLLHGEY